MSWATSTTDLRTLLSDGATDRHRFRKRVFGECNGTNTKFKTFEFRRVTDFTTATAPFGVYKNGVLVSVASDFPDSGDFVLTTAPVDGDVIEASYYVQWFKDAELNSFLGEASGWLGLGVAAVANIPDGLIPAALKYAASQAYLKMAMRWREHKSEEFRLEDAPDPKRPTMTDEFIKMAEAFKKEARQLRDDFYTRQGQSLSPLHATVTGNVRKMP